MTIMPMHRKISTRFICTTILGGGFIASTVLPSHPVKAEVQAEMAGVSAAVTGEIMLAKASGGIGVLVESGMPVYLGDRITTSASSGMQILLLDETVFTIGPNSDVAIDEFVYDPVTGDGRIVADMARGVMRFVTGKIPLNNPSSMDVNLPIGSIGIRGTIGLIRSMTADQANQIIPGSFPQSGNQPVFMAVNQGPGISRNDTTSRPGAFAASSQSGNSQSVTGENFGVFVSDSTVTQPVRFPPGAATFDFSTNLAQTASRSGSNSGSGSSGSSSTGGSGSAQQPLTQQQTGQASTQTGATGAQTFSIALAQLDNTSSGSNATETTSILNNNTEETANSNGSSSGSYTYDALRTITSGSASTGTVLVIDAALTYNFDTVVNYADREISISFTNIISDMYIDGGATITNFDYSSESGNVTFDPNDFSYNSDCTALNCAASVTFRDANNVDFNLKTITVPEGKASSGTLLPQ